MASISKYVYIDKLDDIVDKYNSTIKTEPVNIKWNTFIASSKEINDIDPKFKFGETVRISKYKNIFAKRYVQNSSNDVFMPWRYAISDLKNEQFVGTFYEKKNAKQKNKSKRV